MNRAELREAARARLDDLVEGYGWSDAEINGWIDEACREAWLRQGLQSVAVTVALLAGQAEYALTGSFGYVLSARFSTGRMLVRTTRERMDAYYSAWMAATGTPDRFFLEGNTFTVWPTPTTTATLLLQTRQYPAPLADDTDSPTLEDFSHPLLLEWVIYQAGQKRDADYQLPAPQQYEAAFTRYFGPRPSALTQRGWRDYGGTSMAIPC